MKLGTADYRINNPDLITPFNSGERGGSTVTPQPNNCNCNHTCKFDMEELAKFIIKFIKENKDLIIDKPKEEELPKNEDKKEEETQTPPVKPTPNEEVMGNINDFACNNSTCSNINFNNLNNTF